MRGEVSIILGLILYLLQQARKMQWMEGNKSNYSIVLKIRLIIEVVNYIAKNIPSQY